MNRNITRGLALAALTGGFTILGATAANAIDLPDLGGTGSGSLLGDGGLLGTGIDLGGASGTGNIIDDLRLDLPVDVNGLNVAVLPHSGDGLSLGDGLLLNTGSSNVGILSQLGIDTGSIVDDSGLQGAIVGVPLDVSNTWVSILGTGPNGIAVVPTVAGGVTAELDGLIDGVVDVPIDISCSSVTVLSDYDNECAGGTPGTGGSTGNSGGILDGDLLGGDLLGGNLLGGSIIYGNLLDGELLGDANGDGQITIEDRQLGVLNGDTLGGLGSTDDGVLVDFGDSTGAGDPLNLSNAWLSALGANEGLVIVPDLTLDLSLLTGGLISHEILAPIVIDCVTVTVLSDYERDCGSSTTEEEPTDPEEPTVTPPVTGDNGEVGDATVDDGTVGDAYDACNVVATTPMSDLTSAQQPNIGAIAAAALAGAVIAMLLMLLGSRLGRQRQ